MNATKLLTPREAAERLKVHPVTLWRWAKAGRLPSVALTDGTTRYRASDVEALISGSMRLETPTSPEPRPINSAPSWLDPSAINPITRQPYGAARR
jgi:excisionase family DNA binding protein